MPKIKVNDIELYYEKHGKGDPLVLVPGFTADHLMWVNIVDDFAKDYTVILLDNRGSGRSDAPDSPYTMKMMAEDVAQLCQQLELNACHFIGNSMGAGIVQTLAYHYPGLCRSIILSNGLIKISPAFTLFVKARGALMKAGVDRRTMIELSLSVVFSNMYLGKKDNVDTLIRLSLENPYPMTEVGYRNQLQALLNFDSTPMLNQIHVPCLAIGGDQDIIVKETEMRYLAQQIPNAAYYCFHDVAHLPSIEQPGKFVEVVRQFIRRN